MDDPTPDDAMVLEAGAARLEIRPQDGGRIRSLIIDGTEILVTEGYGPMMWGCYPMAPWAGRIRDGRFTFRGRDVQLPLTMPPHAIHGTAFDRPWEVTGPASVGIDLGPDWPFPGRLSQTFQLADGRLDVRLRLDAEVAMPAVLGWHPWFRRRLELAGGRESLPAALDFKPASMYVRDGDGIATGGIIAPTERPWDDCFTDVAAPPRLTWAGLLTLEMDSSCDHWVIYDQLDEAICIEPQTGPPDFTTIRPNGIDAGDSIEATMTWRWRVLGS